MEKKREEKEAKAAAAKLERERKAALTPAQRKAEAAQKRIDKEAARLAEVARNQATVASHGHLFVYPVIDPDAMNESNPEDSDSSSEDEDSTC